VFLITVAVANFHGPITIEEIAISSQKIQEPLSFVHITDTQLGSTSTAHFNKAWELAFAQDIDFIVFTGDLIDYDHYRKEQFAILKESPVPIYFIRGNHEFMHDTQKLTDMLEQISSITILENEKISVKGIDIFGVEYSEQENFLATQLETVDINDNFNLLLYHEPIDAQIAAQKDIDLMLAGHTHAGQIWPLTYITSLVYPYYNGAHRFDQLTLYTSDGAGLWGPNMRLGTQNEIVVFTLNPK
jgi:predicted MPP superfamily phosphohydrolase